MVYKVIKKFSSILSLHQKRRVIELAFLMLIGGILETCSVSLVVPFMEVAMDPDKIMNKSYIIWICKTLGIDSSRSLLIFIAILLSIVYIVKNAYLLFEYNIQYRFVYGNMFEMQRRLLDNIIHRPYEFFLSVNSSELIRVVNNDTSTTFTLLYTLLSMFTETIVSLMLVVTVFCIAPLITVLMASLLFLLLVFINFFLKPVLHRAGAANQDSCMGMNRWLLQSIQGIKELKVMNREDFFQHNFNEYGKEYVKTWRRRDVLGNAPRFIIEAASMSIIFLIISIMIINGNNLQSLVPVFSAVALAAMRLLPSVNRISMALNTISYGEPMLDKLIENLKDISGEDKVSLMMDLDANHDSRESDSLPDLNESLVLENITYHYPNSERNILDSAGLSIFKGESIGIVGSSGAGKTTTVDIILGLLRPQKGQIKVDGVAIENNMGRWLNQIGYIPQMIFMLDGSIRDNVVFGAPEGSFTEEDVWKALREASLEEFVKSLPEGLDTEIGERGVRVSGGQRQRIGIARALFRNPSILIFDEATSALDNDTEKEIMDSINHLHGKKTMIIIAHRLTTIESCDHVFQVENGTITKER